MKKSILKTNNILKILDSSLLKLPTPSNISIWWNLGSMLGVNLLIQIISGLFLSMHFCPSIYEAFDSVIHIIQDVNYGWMIRLIHMNGASFFFICIFIHIGRNIYYNSFFLIKPWISGIMIFFILMGTAFLGYVLPWGQMSFWGATVITNLISAIPYLGDTIVKWLWGGFSVSNATLNRFYTFHFILPFLILMMVIFHLVFLHETGSSNPLGINSNLNKIPFNPYFSIKDLLGFMILLFLIIIISLLNPYMLSDPENFNQANPLVTPVHIQPEWYFLFAYAILRSIPNKLGGVIALIFSILILIILPFNSNNKIKSFQFYIFSQISFWNFIALFCILTWIGARPVEVPYILIGQISSIFYFSFFIFNPIMLNFIDKKIFI